MSSLRWAIPGFVLGLVVAIGPACGPIGGEKCDARSCQGCCTTDGRCELGTQANACGVGASACQTCGPNDHCSGGICTPLIFGGNDGGNTGTDAGTGDGGMNEDGGMGDGGMGDGGVTCGPGTCSTCCINGQCVAQVNNLTCGQGGNACQTCTGSQTCTNGSCISTSCSGCVTGAGTCLTTSQQSASQCGTGGTTCTACPSGATCQNGTCVGGTTCNAQSCPNGCCSGNTCLPGTSQANCGAGGAACGSCSGSQTCQSTGNGGVCQTTTTNAAIGSPCTSNTQCSSLGSGAYCKQSTSANNATYPGGYCTKSCTKATQASACGGNALCVEGDFTEWGESDSFCLTQDCNLCSQRGAGYQCYGTSPSQFCWLSPAPTPNPPTGVVGNSCSTDTTCQAGVSYPAGFCVTQWTGGYCIGDCSATGVCANDAVCLLLDEGDTMNPNDDFFGCLKSCTTPGLSKGTCSRSGYTCRALFDANGTPLSEGVCLGHCTGTANCPTSFPTCNTSTGFCCNAQGQCV